MQSENVVAQARTRWRTARPSRGPSGRCRCDATRRAGGRCSSHEAGDARHGVEREHERVAEQHVRVVGHRRVAVDAGQDVARAVRRRERGDDEDGDEQEPRDPDAQEEPGAEHLPRLAVPPLERQAGVVHALDEHEVVDAHPLSIGIRGVFVEPVCSPVMGRRVRLGGAGRRLRSGPGAPRRGRRRGQALQEAHVRPVRGRALLRGSIATRIPTWDGVPIDVNVTLPAKRSKACRS